MEIFDQFTKRVRKEFEISFFHEKIFFLLMQRCFFSRFGILCFNTRTLRECQRKDQIWRKKCIEFATVSMENFNVPHQVAMKIRQFLPSRKSFFFSSSFCVYLIRAIDAFNAMKSIIPCDLLEELMHAIVILHQEAALVLGTTQFSVEIFFPLLAYVLVHCHQLPRIHAQLHLLEHFAINDTNINGEESYYVYCVHAAVEFICNTSSNRPETTTTTTTTINTTTTTTTTATATATTTATTSTSTSASMLSSDTVTLGSNQPQAACNS
jgi:hypothetical protein